MSYGTHRIEPSEVSFLLRVHGGYDLGSYFGWADLKATTDRKLVFDALAAAHKSIAPHDYTSRALFEGLVNDILREHRVAYKFVDGDLVPFKSDELLQEVVEPAVRLLVSREFSGAQAAYLAALEEIVNGEPGNAITDAGTALQETLQALGCEGGALGPLIKDAKKRGLLAGHDQNLAAGVTKFLDWASADRSELGDSHNHSHATLDDAWLMVHVAGALIVRLAAEPTRAAAIEKRSR